MTTIAYARGLMACDSCWSLYGRVDVLATKMWRLSSGGLLGQAGDNDGRGFVEMLDKVRSAEKLPRYADLAAIRQDALCLLVLPNGRLFKIATTGVTPENWTMDFQDRPGLWELPDKFGAVGTGGDLAMVAMRCGKSAREAVRIACDYDLYSRPPVHQISLMKLK